MILKKHLHFVGNMKDKEITFHNVKCYDKDIVIDVDDYDKIWDYLNILSESNNTLKIEEWKMQYGVSDEEMQEINSFLCENEMIYESYEETNNIRSANFFNNYIPVKNNTDVLREIEQKKVMIIGVGTVGTALISGLQQLGINKFVLVDDDVVDERNIMHQRNYRLSDVGRKKCHVLSERMLELNVDCEIITYNKFINNIVEFKKIIEETNPEVVFCCFDNHTSTLLLEMYEYLEYKGIVSYISGYMMSMVKAYKLNRAMINEEIEFEKKSKDIITDNAGIGVLGDVAALLMIRLWLQTIYDNFEMNLTSLEYDFINPSENGKFYLDDLEKKIENNELNENRKNNIIFPYLLIKYVRFLCGKSSELDNLEDCFRKYSLDFFDELDRENEEYLEGLDNLYIQYCDEKISILKFSEMALYKDMPIDCYNQCINQQQKIVDIAVALINKKKKKYYEEYLKMWEEKKLVKKSLTTLARFIAKKAYPVEIDFLKYKPFNNTGYSLTLQKEINLIKQLDSLNKYTDYAGFIDYCYEHNFIHVIENGENSVCVYNSRYGNSDIIISKNRCWQDIFFMAHEIGHGYYNSFCPKGVSVIDEITSETFSLLTEYRIIKMLINTDLIEIFKDVIKNRLYGVAIGMYSLDLYEEGILRLDDINFDSIIKIRESVNKKLFDDIIIKNDFYSRYNMFMNTDMVIQKRNIYLYPEAMLIGFDLGRRIEENAEIELLLIDFVKNLNTCSDIYNFYESIGVEKIDYDEMVHNILKLWEQIE